MVNFFSIKTSLGFLLSEKCSTPRAIKTGRIDSIFFSKRLLTGRPLVDKITTISNVRPLYTHQNVYCDSAQSLYILVNIMRSSLIFESDPAVVNTLHSHHIGFKTITKERKSCNLFLSVTLFKFSNYYTLCRLSIK